MNELLSPFQVSFPAAHIKKNAAFITKWPFCSPGCVVPALETAYLCKM